MPVATSPGSLPAETSSAGATSLAQPTSNLPFTSTPRRSTPSPVYSPTPDYCNPSLWFGNDLFILSTDVFRSFNPGGPTVYNQVLIKKNPAWADFRQEDQGEMRNAGVIFHEASFGPEMGMGANPAIVLVVYGVKYDWVLPENGDLVSVIYQIRDSLYQDETDWSFRGIDQSQYPPIENGATFAIYRYFEGDQEKLEAWCRTFVEVYDVNPIYPDQE